MTDWLKMEMAVEEDRRTDAQPMAARKQRRKQLRASLPLRAVTPVTVSSHHASPLSQSLEDIFKQVTTHPGYSTED